jgi:Rrf2 family transcriptional regulator, cysteine metabolism repressor
MKLSTRSRYGTRAMLEIARHYGKAPLKRNDIIKAQGISKSYLENILITLKASQLITTERGASGGFTLKHSPAKTTLYQIVSTLEGSLAPVECVESPSTCEKSGRCVVRKAWNKLHQAQVECLKGITLQDLLEMEEKGQALDYSI